MSDARTVTVQVKHSYQASPERVFDAFLDPALARRFMFATPTGEMIRAEVDPRVGGRFTFTDRRPDMGDVEHVGEYVEIDRPRRLVFLFGVPQYDPAMTRVTIEITPNGPGSDLVLTHDGVLEQYAEGTPKGWTMILGALAEALR
jgi:uncharacterized protein YndB with AHSA1/START domain